MTVDVVVQAAEDSRDGGLAESNAFHRTKSRVDRTHARRTEVTPTSGSQRRQRRRARRTHAPCCCCCRCCCRPCHLRCCCFITQACPCADAPCRTLHRQTGQRLSDDKHRLRHTYSHPPTTPTTPQISYHRRHTHARAILRALVAIAGLTAAPPDLISLPADRVLLPQFS